MNLGKETEYLEFKRSLSETKEGLCSISAMLNKHHKGTLYFGVKDNGDVIGQDIGKDTLNKLSRDISEFIKPAVYYEVEQKNTREGMSFIEVIFHGDHVPYSAYGRYYLRFHDEDRQMDNDTLRKYYLDQRNDYSKWEKENSGVSIDKVDASLLEKYIEKAKQKKRISIENDNPRALLGKLGLLYDEKYLNNAGNVLFSITGPVQLKLAIFAGETRLTVLNLDVFSGNIFECIDKGMDYYSSNINWRAEFNGGIHRIEKPEIPLVAVREILLNAFCHGDYNSNTDFELVIYRNRISIYSPGHFPKPYTPEMFVQKGLPPIPFNAVINNTLYRSGAIEQFSTGFERVFEACDAEHIRYEYEETPNGFRFTFYRPDFTKPESLQSSGVTLDGSGDTLESSGDTLGGVNERTEVSQRLHKDFTKEQCDSSGVTLESPGVTLESSDDTLGGVNERTEVSQRLHKDFTIICRLLLKKHLS